MDGVAPVSETRTDLVGLSREELAREMAAMGAEPFRVRQLWHWI
jgi:23S rRNA (adenine2503-C2)-methyltransferase